MMVITAKTAPNFRLAILSKEKRKEKKKKLACRPRSRDGREEGRGKIDKLERRG